MNLMLIVFERTHVISIVKSQHMKHPKTHYLLFMLHINVLPFVNVRTIFGHTPVSDNFWTEICTAFRASDVSDRFFF